MAPESDEEKFPRIESLKLADAEKKKQEAVAREEEFAWKKCLELMERFKSRIAALTEPSPSANT